MSSTGKVAAAIVLVFGSGVATVLAESGPDSAEHAASAPGAAPTTTTTTTTAAVPVAVADAPTPGVDIAPTAAIAAEPAPVPRPKAAPPARESAPVAPTPAPVAPAVPAAIPDVAPLVPAVPVITPSAPTSGPELVRPVCTDTSLDHRSPDLSGLGLEAKASRTAMIEAYARCVADGGAIDPRHDDINGDGDYCGGHVPTGAVGLASAVDAQSDCLAALASRDGF